MTQQDPPETPRPETTAEEIGRRAAELLKSAGPRLTEIVDQARPKVEKAGRDAIDFARSHEDELREAATRLTQVRFAGPLGDALSSVMRAAADPAPASAALTCASCQAANPPNARFCNQCGAAIPASDGGSAPE